MNKMVKMNNYHRKIRQDEDLNIMEEYFNSEYFVHNGPFKGMNYINKSSGSALLPKILGSYEEPIQEWIEKVINRKYNKIIDVGCAEGFYTAGFAFRMPHTKIYGFDIDAEALKNANELIKLNSLNNVELQLECTHNQLGLLCDEDTLVFCDIEGFENVLLDPLKVPNLIKANLIIESHDFLVEGVSDLLINRFYKTHKITIVIDYTPRINKYDFPRKLTSELFERTIQEYRQVGTRFILMERLS